MAPGLLAGRSHSLTVSNARYKPPPPLPAHFPPLIAGSELAGGLNAGPPLTVKLIHLRDKLAGVCPVASGIGATVVPVTAFVPVSVSVIFVLI